MYVVVKTIQPKLSPLKAEPQMAKLSFSNEIDPNWNAWVCTMPSLIIYVECLGFCGRNS